MPILGATNANTHDTVSCWGSCVVVFSLPCCQRGKRPSVTECTRSLVITQCTSSGWLSGAEPSPGGTLRLCGGALCSFRGAWRSNLTKIPLTHRVSYFNLGVLELCLGGLSPPMATVLVRCQAKFLTSRHVSMHRVIFNISNTLRKLMIGAQGVVLR